MVRKVHRLVLAMVSHFVLPQIAPYSIKLVIFNFH